ncbi:hypothetical protein [[Clostridium] polysaccharolyticum]|uniref:Uncharacterized protein n=1 Tax=[Clostridium] polysaccharolyticum TaxID=29364 RepID=A0A1H9YNL7_9FIRM|nr:hypothetical protein [[Clostridium] polysaccharolyticum]SES70197.1 hypothetical protein SAMN04487772_10296 [[Clostridium] polysaccharolyticum]
MKISFGANFIPVVYLTAAAVGDEDEDCIVVEGQEGLEEEYTRKETKPADSDLAGEEAVNSENYASEGEAIEEADMVEGEEKEVTEEETAEETTKETGESGQEEDNESQPLQGEVKQSKEPVFGRPAVLGGCSLLMLLAGCVLGFLLAKKQIKKESELSEEI